MRRKELSDRQWELICDLLPPNGQHGGQWTDHRRLLNAILWILRTGAPCGSVDGADPGGWRATRDTAIRAFAAGCDVTASVR